MRPVKPPESVVAILAVLLAFGPGGFGPADAQPPRSPAPVAPNESAVTAKVLSAVVVDSTTLNMSPSQPLCVLTLTILTVGPSVGRGDDLVHGRAGTTVTAYSKDLSLAASNGTIIAARLSYGGDERGGGFWVTSYSTTIP